MACQAARARMVRDIRSLTTMERSVKEKWVTVRMVKIPDGKEKMDVCLSNQDGIAGLHIEPGEYLVTGKSAVIAVNGKRLEITDEPVTVAVDGSKDGGYTILE